MIGDRRGCVAGGVEIDAGAGFALDDAIGFIGDGDRIVAGDAVTGAVDQATGMIADHTAFVRLEVDGIIAVTGCRGETNDPTVIIDVVFTPPRIASASAA